VITEVGTIVKWHDNRSGPSFKKENKKKHISICKSTEENVRKYEICTTEEDKRLLFTFFKLSPISILQVFPFFK
jgi:hypothetical protein